MPSNAYFQQNTGNFHYPTSNYQPFPPSHGFLSKFKNSIAAAGNALATGIQSVNEGYQYRGNFLNFFL